MAIKNQVKAWNFLIALLVAAIIFFSGLFLGLKITSLKVSEISEDQNSLAINLEALELRYDLLKENVCNFELLNKVGRELDELGKNLPDIEKYGGSNAKNIEEAYFLLEIRHYLLLKRTEEACGKDFDFILYFYALECKDCEEQGYILGYMQNKIGYDKIKVYSFDINSESPAVKTLLEIYKVKALPTIVVNDKAYEGFKNLDVLEKILESE